MRDRLCASGWIYPRALGRAVDRVGRAPYPSVEFVRELAEVLSDSGPGRLVCGFEFCRVSTPTCERITV